MRFRPCIDLHRGRVAQIVGSTLDNRDEGPVVNFQTDHSPARYARLYARDGLTGGHVIMLGPGNESAALDALRAYPGGLQVGGGITPENASVYLDAGASHVIVTSFVFHQGRIDYSRLDRIETAVGSSRLVLDLSCRKQDKRYLVATDRWQTLTDTPIDGALLTALGSRCAEFLVHAVDVEGKQQGIDEALVYLLSCTSPIAVTYAGGVRTLDDLEKIKTAGQGRVDATVGSALDIFGGPLSYRSVVQWHHQSQGPNAPHQHTPSAT